MARTPPPPRSGFAVTVPLQTRWADNDAYGHMNNATYYALFDTAMSVWQLENGIALTGPEAQRFVIVESGCTYFREVAFPDRLTAGLRIPTIGRSSYRIEIALFRDGEDTAAALGHFVCVLTDATGAPTAIGDALRSTLESLAPQTGL